MSSTLTAEVCDNFQASQYKLTVYPECVCLCGFNPEPAQGVLSRAGHHGDVREESGALWRVLESRSGDVAETLWLQHGHYSCNQCTYKTQLQQHYLD